MDEIADTGVTFAALQAAVEYIMVAVPVFVILVVAAMASEERNK